MSCAALIALFALSCETASLRGQKGPSGAQAVAKLRSNILRGDYAGSGACARCHADIFARWSRSPMHNMTRRPEHAKIAAPFAAGAVFRFKDDAAILSEQGGARFLKIESGRFGNRLFRITKIIGGHHREDFAGIEVAEPSPTAPPIGGKPHEERVLPVSFMLGSQSFRYKGYSVMGPERPGLRPGGVWNRTCIFCHNTVPYLSTIFGALSGPGTPPYQGEVVDPLLPPERRQEFVIGDENALRQAIIAELAFLRGRKSDEMLRLEEEPLEASLKQSVRYTRGLFSETHVVEIGIGCESCHGGSKEHVQDSYKRPSYVPRSGFLSVRPEPKNTAQAINRVCARCHQVLFSHYPFTWEGGMRKQNPGGANINSGKGRDMLLGGCASELSCVACHDPHAPENENQRRMAELETKAGNTVCLRCHGQYREKEALRAHSHHDPDGPGSQCLSCHMPKKNMSLETRLSRYHRIGSPTDPVRVQNDRPLECALCHGDRSVESLVADMERWYKKSYDRVALRSLYGELSSNVLMTTLQRGKPHEQAVAIALLGQARRKDAVPLLARQLVHPLPILRYYALQALQEIVGKPAPFDLHQENSRITEAAQKWLVDSQVLAQPDSETPAGSAPPIAAPDSDDE